ncbi:MAG: hypothetical protein JST52_10445, partial [Bacteroidetes bacterium]|nr:hypothetical protein [Bacteroidota bacterium]
ESCGESIPASHRYKWHPVAGNKPLRVFLPRYFLSPSLDSPWLYTDYGTLHFGDATEHLGNYITALSTEFYMLKSNGLSTARTSLELYLALKAFDRLDAAAEDYSHDIDGTYPCNPDNYYRDQKGKDPLNGFFIRNDVPSYHDPAAGYTEFVQQNLLHFNRPGRNFKAISVSDGAYHNRLMMNGFIHPYHTTWGSSKTRVPSEESQDQLVQLYMGTGLATRLVDQAATYNGKYLARWAGDIQYRLIKYAGYSYNGPGANPHWQIKNPVTTQCVYGIEPTYDCNAGGADVLHLGVGASLGLLHSAKSVGACTSGDALTLAGFAGSAYMGLWMLMGNAPGLLSDLVYSCTYAAFADNWKIPGICYNQYGFPYPCMKNVTRSQIRKVCTAIDDIRYPQVSMAYELVSGPGPGHGSSQFDPSIWGIPSPSPSYPTLFNKAPSCGCYNYADNNNPNNYGNFFWSSHNWSQDYDKRGHADQVPADYNNLDYMQLFNLYNLNDAKYLSYYFNGYYHEYYSTNYPYTTPIVKKTIGDNANPVGLQLLEYLSLKNKHFKDANLTYRGAKTIDLLPGFEANTGSTVLIYAKDFRCSERPTDYQTRTTLLGGDAPDEDPYYYASVGGIPLDEENLVEYDDSTLAALAIVPYRVQTWDNPDYDSTTMPDTTPEEIQTFVDSLVNIVYSSGDDYLINKAAELGFSPSAHRTQPSDNRHLSVKNAAPSRISLYPNPSQGIIEISSPDKDALELSVFTLAGIKIYADKLTGSLHYTVQLPPACAAGSYTVAVVAHEQRYNFPLIIIK